MWAQRARADEDEEALDNMDEAEDVMEQTSSLFLSDDYKEVTWPWSQAIITTSTCFLVYLRVL